MTQKSSVLGYHFVFALTVFLYKVTSDLARDSSVGIATRYGLDGPGLESQ
jgi:hypothetical protein